MKRLILACLLVACSKSSEQPASPSDAATGIRGTLAVEIRQTVDVTISPAAQITLAFGEGDFGVLEPNTKFTVNGAIEPLPEASATMYTATWAAPKRSAGPCGEQPMTFALSLVRRGQNTRVGGGLTAYCGPNATGVPARVLRLSGDLSL